MSPLSFIFIVFLGHSALSVSGESCTDACCSFNVSFYLRTCEQTVVAWETPLADIECSVLTATGNYTSCPCDGPELTSKPSPGKSAVKVCRNINYTDPIQYELVESEQVGCVPDPCANKTLNSCEECVTNSNCLWCESTETCMTGTWYGGASECALTKWEWKQCTMAGLWVLVICAAIVVVVIFLFIALLCCCCRKGKKTNKDELQPFLE